MRRNVAVAKDVDFEIQIPKAPYPLHIRTPELKQLGPKLFSADKAVVSSGIIPSDPGLASLRGAAICALRAVGGPVPPLGASRVDPLQDARIVERYERYKELRV